MKIVLLNDQLKTGGAEKMLVFIANLLYKNGCDVSVVLFLGHSNLDEQINSNIKINYLQRKSKFDCKAWKKLKSLTKNADIVHVHSRYNLRYFMLVKFLLNINKPKVVFHEHGPNYNLDFFTKYLFKKIDAYVAVHEVKSKWVVENKFVASSKSFYLKNTVYPPQHTVMYENNIAGKLMMVGNLNAIKNHFFAIHLIKILPENYTLDIYGNTADENYYNEVVQEINKNQLQSRVKMIHGITDLYAVMKNYTLAIHTSKAETGPLVLIEYLFARLPFVTYETGDVVKIVKEKIPEFIEPHFNIESWKNKIFFLEKNGRDESYSNKMKSILDKEFSEEAYYQNLVNIYKKVAKQ